MEGLTLITVGNTTFNPTACQNLTFAEFEKSVSPNYSGSESLEAIYNKMVGSRPDEQTAATEKKAKKKPDETR